MAPDEESPFGAFLLIAGGVAAAKALDFHSKVARWITLALEAPGDTI